MAYVRSDVRRRHIVDAAFSIIAAEGLDAVTTRRIADEAGASLSTIHYCFRDKAEMIREVERRVLESYLAAIPGPAPDSDLAGTIRELVDGIWRWIKEEKGVALVAVELSIWRMRQQTNGGDGDFPTPWVRVLVSRLQTAVDMSQARYGLPMTDIATLMAAGIDGIILMYGLSNDLAKCERQAALLAESLVQLLASVCEPTGSG